MRFTGGTISQVREWKSAPEVPFGGFLFPEAGITEDFCGEGFYGCTLLPGVQRKSGFAAGLFEEGHAVPVVFDGNLRQKQAAVALHAYEKAVAADLDFVRRNWLGWSENAEFDLQAGRFFAVDGFKACVVEGGGAGGLSNGTIDGTGGEDVADASAELVLQIERGEYAARFAQVRRWRLQG